MLIKIWKNLISSYTFNIFAWSIFVDIIIGTIIYLNVPNGPLYNIIDNTGILFLLIELAFCPLFALAYFIEKRLKIKIKNEFILNNEKYATLVAFLAFLNLQKLIITTPILLLIFTISNLKEKKEVNNP